MVQKRWGIRTLSGTARALLVLGALVLAGYSQAAAETEVREFAIHVDGKHAGTYQMTITSQNTGVTVMSGGGFESLTDTPELSRPALPSTVSTRF